VEFELLEHPADIGFRARGDSLEDLFANCAFALMSIIFDISNIEGREEVLLSADGADRESLLVNWLNEVLFYIDTRRMAFQSFDLAFSSPHELTCRARCEARDPVRHPVRLAVKAATYHQLRVFPSNDGWIAEVYVDV
jgi:SHS2 domain-containing protein